MIAEVGHFALILALAVAAFQCVVPLVGAHIGNRAMAASAVPASLIQLILIYVSFTALMHAYITSDFSVANVFENSHSAKPLLYKISGVWGNHEGSMLLWVLILAIFGASVALFGDNLPPTLKARVLAVQGSIGTAFLLFIVVTSNPFARLNPAPIEGNGLNPLLQDPALAFHPPFLYAGYVGLSIAFSFAIAALIDGKVDAAWARWVRPWTLAAWMFLTIGISMPPGCFSPSASAWEAGGPIMNWAGVVGGSGTRWKMPASCPGWWQPPCCIRRSLWKNATR